MTKTKTAGHIAYEAFCQTRPQAYSDWVLLTSASQAQWEAAAKAVSGRQPETKAERKARKHQEWMERTCALIDEHRRIILKKRGNIWYLSQHTCIQAGSDGAEWACLAYAMMIEDLRWAFSLARLYKCEVWSIDASNGSLRRELP